jgi:putative ABC transport system permease protein
MPVDSNPGTTMPPESYLELTAGQVALAAALVLLNGAVSLALRLGLERSLLYAAARMTVQLLLIGYVLRWVFAMDRWPVVVGVGLVMTLIAGAAAVQRTELRYRGVWLGSLLSVWVSSWLVAGVGLLVIVRADPWYRPQYALPLLGMILGNALNGISLGLDRLGRELRANRAVVETLLALGATSWEAALPSVREALRTSLIPTVNTMLVAGIVSLPGMMTGQLLSGVEPLQAVKYQIVIMFLISATVALGSLAVVLFSFSRLFNRDHQLTDSQ